jgi:hypothetical protein
MRCLLRALLLAGVLAGRPVPAQLIVSTIRGSVTDPAGSAVAGANVTVVNTGTNIERAVVSNDNGDYELSDLVGGTYRLTVRRPGFKTFVADNLILENTEVRRVDVALEVGALSSEVTVRADAAVITTDTAKIQSSFTSKRFDDAPWVGDGRNPQTLLTTLPLVQATSGVYGVQLAGQPDKQVQTAIDGIPGDGSSLQASNVHAMQEVDVVTGNNSAEFSRPAYISMATKGGSNQFHGRAVYWHQNSALSARNFFDAAKPKNLFHTMDAEISGPIFKDRTFFLFSWSGQRWPSSTFNLLSVPTNLMRQGDFSELLGISKSVTVKDPLSGAPFPNNVIPTSRLNPTSTQIMQQYLPGPNLGAPGALANNFGWLFPYPGDLFRWDSYDYRLDHKLTAKNLIWARLLTSKPLYVLAGTYPAFTWTRVRDSLTLVIEDTHIFSPGLVNTARFGLYRPNILDGTNVNGVSPLKGDQAVKAVGIQGVNPQNLSAMGFPRVDITGYSSLREQPGGVNQINKNWDYADSLTWAHGRHVAKFGADFRYLTNFSGLVPEASYGYFTFNGNFSGYGFSDFLLGLPFSSQRLNPLTNRTQLDNETGIYVQDAFKVSSRLTLDLGLRWERFGAANYDDGLVYNWDPASGNVLVPSKALNAASPLYPKTINLVTGPAAQNPSLHNFTPRIGVAWRPFGDRFVIRGGYGIYTETLGPYARAQGGGPFQLTETFFNSVTNGQALFAFPNPFPSGSGSVPSQSVAGFNPDTHNGQIHQFNATLERQVADIGLRLSYLGIRSRNLNYTREIDKPQPSLTPFTAARRPYSQFVSTTVARNDGAANFNSLTLEAQRKVGQVTFDAHWAWSSNYNNMLNLENPYAPLFWARDPNTVRHRVVLNVIWNIPVGKGHRILGSAPAVVNPVLGGWQLYWIGYFETGQFFSPSFSGSDPSNTNTSGGLPNRICNGNLLAGQRSITRWFDASCFTVPAPGQFGNSAPDVLEGPGLQLNNLTIGKTFPIHERLRFTFVLAAQNALNHPNFANPSSANSNISAPATVGVINAVDGFAPGRQIMLRGRIEF